MKATELIEIALDNSRNWAMGLINDMQDLPLATPTDRGGNHPLWVLGHLTHSDSQLLDVYVFGKENRFPELAQMFGMSSEPPTDASQCPSMSSLMEKNASIRAAIREHLASLSDDDLDRKTFAPEEFASYFGTVGAVYAAMSTHYGFHAGQVADARRAAGRVPVMA